MLIWTLVQQLGVDWPRAERQRRLFHVCVRVQATLMARYPGYQTTSVHTVPEAVVDEVKEMLRNLTAT